MSVQSSMVMMMNTVRKAWYMSSKRVLGSCGLPTCVCEWGRGVCVFVSVFKYFCLRVCVCMCVLFVQMHARTCMCACGCK